MRMVALGVYASCVVALLAISGTYHSLDHGGPARAFMQHVDYFAIWLLIAGTFTAVHGIMCSGFWRRGMLTFIWLYAAAGIGLQVFWFQFFSGVPGLVLYLGLGWVGLISIIRLGRQIGFRAVRPLWFAGIFFSAGAVLEAIKQPVLIRNWVGPHEIFHLPLIAAVVFHWRFPLRLLLLHAPTPVPFAQSLSLTGGPSFACPRMRRRCGPGFTRTKRAVACSPIHRYLLPNTPSNSYQSPSNRAVWPGSEKSMVSSRSPGYNSAFSRAGNRL